MLGVRGLLAPVTSKVSDSQNKTSCKNAIGGIHLNEMCVQDERSRPLRWGHELLATENGSYTTEQPGQKTKIEELMVELSGNLCPLCLFLLNDLGQNFEPV